MSGVRILIADDHEVVRRGVRVLLEAHAGWEVCAEAVDGQILISESAYRAAGVDLGPLEQRSLELKGKSQPMTVYVLKAAAASGQP